MGTPPVAVASAVPSQYIVGSGEADPDAPQPPPGEGTVAALRSTVEG